MTLPLNPNDPNVVMLELVARRLGAQLCGEFAFVGGAVAGLLITDPANPPIRATEDVDVVAEVLALRDYHALDAALRERGFAQDMRPGAAICRWQVEGVAVDVMPTDEKISALLRDRRFIDALPGHLPSDFAGQSRLPDLELKLRHIADLAKS
jgi:hypothetical protein